MKKRKLIPLNERIRRSRMASEIARNRQCQDCGSLCPSSRGNVGEYGNCLRCGGAPSYAAVRVLG